MRVESRGLRAKLVEELVRKGSLRTEAVREAFLAVPRELFVPQVAAERGLEAVYRDEVLVTRTDAAGDPTSSSSMPGVMARMLEQLDLQPGQRVLEIGAGTGYNAALMKVIVGRSGRVVTIELDPELARGARAALRAGRYQVRVVAGDGHHGWDSGAPYDRIIATASSARIPASWLSQLSDGGIVELPWRLSESVFTPQLAIAFRRRGPWLMSVTASPVGFMAMRGAPRESAPSDPELRIIERLDGDQRTLLLVSGRLVGELSREARTRLIGLVSGPGESRPLKFRSDWLPLASWIALHESSRCIIANGFGLADPRGTGVAVIRGTTRWATRIHAWGSAEPADRLEQVSYGYQAAGKPSLEALEIAVGPRRRDGWTTSFRRGGFIVSARWRDRFPERGKGAAAQ